MDKSYLPYLNGIWPMSHKSVQKLKRKGTGLKACTANMKHYSYAYTPLCLSHTGGHQNKYGLMSSQIR